MAILLQRVSDGEVSINTTTEEMQILLNYLKISVSLEDHDIDEELNITDDIRRLHDGVHNQPTT